MGYESNISLKMIGDIEEINKVKQAAEELDVDDDVNYDYDIQELITEECVETYLYNFKDYFIPWASQFQNVLFILEGYGEDRMDIWELRIKGSVSEYHKVEMPPFTNSNLLTETEE